MTIKGLPRWAPNAAALATCDGAVGPKRPLSPGNQCCFVKRTRNTMQEPAAAMASQRGRAMATAGRRMHFRHGNIAFFRNGKRWRRWSSSCHVGRATSHGRHFENSVATHNMRFRQGEGAILTTRAVAMATMVLPRLAPNVAQASRLLLATCLFTPVRMRFAQRAR